MVKKTYTPEDYLALEMMRIFEGSKNAIPMQFLNNYPRLEKRVQKASKAIKKYMEQARNKEGASK